MQYTNPKYTYRKDGVSWRTSLMTFLLCTFLFAPVGYGNDSVTLTGRTLEKYPDAVCNSGSPASIFELDIGADKWALIFEGGGSATSASEYKRRTIGRGTLTKSLVSDLGVKSIEKQFVFPTLRSKGFNIVWVPYCSSDSYLGNHEHDIDGTRVQFRGDRIFRAVIDDLAPRLNRSSQVLVGGWSAGAIGVGAHLDFLRENISTNVRFVFDSYWLDEAELKLRKSWQKNERIEFVTKSLPSQCTSDWINCFPSKETLDRYNVDDAFIVWNVGDSYRRSSDDQIMKASVISDIEKFGGGISLGRQQPVRGGLGAHVVLFAESYEQDFGGKTPKQVFENWLDVNSDSILINFDEVDSGNPELVKLVSNGGDRKSIAIKVPDLDVINTSKGLVILTSGADCRDLSEWSNVIEKFGFAAVGVDHCSYRNLNRNRITNFSGYSNVQRAFDLTTVIEHLEAKGMSNIPVVVMSFSQGGAALNEMASKPGFFYLQRQGVQGALLDRINAYISFYPFCTTQIPERPIKPYLVNIAGDDTAIDKAFCKKFEDGTKGNLTIMTYKSAPHGFDQEGVDLVGQTKMGSAYQIKFDENAFAASKLAVADFLKSLRL